MNTRNDKPLRGARWPWVAALILAVVGIAATLLLWRRMDDLERRNAVEEFRGSAQMVEQSVAREIALFMEVLVSLRDLHTLSDRISADEFEEFVAKGMRHQERVLGSFGFIQRIPDERRVPLESTGENPLVIKEPDRAGHFTRAADRPEYFAVTYQVPADGLRVPTGFDFAATEPNSSSIEAMMRLGHLTMGGRAPGEDRAHYVFAPILYDTIAGTPVVPPGYLYGFVAAILKPDDLLDRSVGSLARSVTVEFRTQPRPTKGPGAQSTGGTPVSPSFVYEATVAVADQSWTLRCEATPEFIARRQSHRSLIVLGAGFLLTALVTMEFLLMAGRSRRTELLVRERTSDLVQAKERLEVEMSERRRLEQEVLEISSREQERVGRDLHDSLGQKLTGASFLSRALATTLADAQRPEKDQAERITEVLKDSISQVRRIARGLSPVDFEEEGLADALHRLAAETEANCSVTCMLKSEPGLSLPGRSAVQLYHIAQEAISNAVRHGKARKIFINLDARELAVTDDGIGLPADATRTGGMGLKIMRYRSSLLGAKIDVRRGDRGGTVVTCRF